VTLVFEGMGLPVRTLMRDTQCEFLDVNLAVAGRGDHSCAALLCVYSGVTIPASHIVDDNVLSDVA
jgi:hypothetical protein